MFLSVNGSNGFSAIERNELELVAGGWNAGEIGGAITLPGIGRREFLMEATRENAYQVVMRPDDGAVPLRGNPERDCCCSSPGIPPPVDPRPPCGDRDCKNG